MTAVPSSVGLCRILSSESAAMALRVSKCSVCHALGMQRCECKRRAAREEKQGLTVDSVDAEPAAAKRIKVEQVEQPAVDPVKTELTALAVKLEHCSSSSSVGNSTAVGGEAAVCGERPSALRKTMRTIEVQTEAQQEHESCHAQFASLQAHYYQRKAEWQQELQRKDAIIEELKKERDALLFRWELCDKSARKPTEFTDYSSYGIHLGSYLIK